MIVTARKTGITILKLFGVRLLVAYYVFEREINPGD
jgi:hypothetical protein